MSVYYLKLIRVLDNMFSLPVFAFILGVLLESIMYESSINFVGSGVAFIILGILSNKIHTKHTGRSQIKSNNEISIQKTL